MKMILIQDGSQNTNVDKPLRIIGDPYKVQVGAPSGLGLLEKRGRRVSRGLPLLETMIERRVERF